MNDLKRKIRIGAVSYLNTKPLVYGFEQGMMADKIELTYNYPGKLAESLIDDNIDIGLVPVAIIPQLKQHFIISDFGIACDGAVDSVFIFCNIPITEIKTILLDYQSRTSVVLAKYLLQNFWKVNPQFKNADDNFLEQINDTTAAVVIGDRTFAAKQKFSFAYDLGKAWKDCTGLPFVFALWIANKPMSTEFCDEFNLACQFGLSQIDAVIAKNFSNKVDLKKYYTENIHFIIDEPKQAGLNKFLEINKLY